MDSGPIYHRIFRKIAVVLVTGSMTFGVASSCDPEVRTTILEGLNGFAGTLLDAFFLNIENNAEEGATVTVETVDASVDIA